MCSHCLPRLSVCLARSNDFVLTVPLCSQNEIGKQEEAEASTRQMGQSLHALLSDDKFAKRQLSAKTQERNLEQTELDASKLYVTTQEVSNVEQQTGRVDDARERNSAYFPAGFP